MLDGGGGAAKAVSHLRRCWIAGEVFVTHKDVRDAAFRQRDEQYF